MKVLAIKQPWASLIAEGKKTIEVRSRPVVPENIEGRIAIYATLSPWDKGTVSLSHKHLDEWYLFPHGAIIATAELYYCKQYTWNYEFVQDRNKHLIPLDELNNYSCGYGWCLRDIKKLEQPIGYKMPKGCVVWANYEGKL